MSFGRIGIGLVATALSVVAPGPVRAQSSEPPSNAPVQIGPLALSPSFRLTNFGHDSNVYNRTSDNDPKGDVTATLSPAVDAWLSSPHARVRGRSGFDFYYFKQLTDLRALDTDTSARLEVPLNRLTPYFAGTLLNTRHRQNLEIDAIARRRNDSVTAGVDMRLTGKVSAGVYAVRSRIEYQPNSLYLGTDLARVLNHKSLGEGVAFRWAATPFTTFIVEMERQRDRFDSASDRNSDTVRVAPSVEFNPLALVSGRASIGFQRSRFLTGALPPFNGTIATADLNYTLRARTRFTIAGRRQLQYSYLVGQYEYVEAGVTASVTQRLGDAWDAGGSFGRSRLTYRQASTPITTLGIAVVPDETVLTSAADFGYNMGRMRIGLHLEHRSRQTDVPVLNRTYQRSLVGSTLTYAF